MWFSGCWENTLKALVKKCRQIVEAGQTTVPWAQEAESECDSMPGEPQTVRTSLSPLRELRAKGTQTLG